MTLNALAPRRMMAWTRQVLGRVGTYTAKASAVTLGVVASGLPPARRD